MTIVATDPAGADLGRQEAVRRFRQVRTTTLALTDGVPPEDQVIQPMADASPTKWHLAHTSWFFETFLLQPLVPGYRPFDDSFNYLFNSYYEAVGPRHPRPDRGMLSRPTVAEVRRYRAHVDVAVETWIATAGSAQWAAGAATLDLGLHHEQQHQELLVTDLKYVLAQNYRMPVYRAPIPPRPASGDPLGWHEHPGGVVEIGHAGGSFAFDNEGPRHRTYVQPFAVASRLVTCGEFADFIADDGYRRPALWLSEGWAAVCAGGWQAPLYWEAVEAGATTVRTLAGSRLLDPQEPVCHVSYFEADAFARWAGKRLPGEAEWELMARERPMEGNFAEAGAFHPQPAVAGPGPRQLYGDVWEWTQSPYMPYPGYRPPAGAISEYNGKFMCNQMVLRGGSCATPADHIRATYRNFFPPGARWQFSGLRLAMDL